MIHTAEITYKDLKSAREKAELYQYQVAHLLHVSEDTVSRWERGEMAPTPDQVSEMEALYKAPGLWYGWMRYQYKSFRDRYPEKPEGAELALSMLDAGFQLQDMMKRHEDALRDALDGRIDNARQFAEYIKEAKEAHAALGVMLAKAECREDG